MGDPLVLRLLSGTVVVLLVATAASGQIVQPQPSGVEMEPGSLNVRLSVERAAEAGLVVRHTGGIQDPLGQFGVPRDFRVAHLGAPEGWTVEIHPADFTLEPRQQQEVTVRIQISTDAVRQGEVQVVAQLKPYGAPDIPGLGPLADPEAEANLTISGERAEPFTRETLERLGSWIWVVILAFLAAVLLSTKLLVDRRRRTVHLHCDQARMEVRPGGRAVFRVLVENSGRQGDTVVFHVADPPAGWAAFLPVPEMKLKADHVEEVQFIVIAPKDAEEGLRQELAVVAAGSRSRGRPATLVLEVVVAGQGPDGGPARTSPSRQ